LPRSPARGGAAEREGAAGSTIYPSSSLYLRSCLMRYENNLYKFRATLHCSYPTSNNMRYENNLYKFRATLHCSYPTRNNMRYENNLYKFRVTVVKGSGFRISCLLLDEAQKWHSR
jgi:hypothetical protein